jgi:hypothetical protein
MQPGSGRLEIAFPLVAPDRAGKKQNVHGGGAGRRKPGRCDGSPQRNHCQASGPTDLAKADWKGDCWPKLRSELAEPLSVEG